MCIDDNGGMLFNKRRQSRDLSVIKKISAISENGVLRMNEYSKVLFSDSGINNITVSRAFLDEASGGEWCFVETEKLKAYASEIEKIIVFRWNRIYPSDFVLDISLDKFNLVSSEDFPGNSHEKITMEVYVQ